MVVEQAALPLCTVAILHPVVAVAPVLRSAAVRLARVHAVMPGCKVDVVAISANPVSSQKHFMASWGCSFRGHVTSKAAEEGGCGELRDGIPIVIRKSLKPTLKSTIDPAQ